MPSSLRMLPAWGNAKTDDARSSRDASDCASLEWASSATSWLRLRTASRWRKLVNRRFHLSRSALFFFF